MPRPRKPNHPTTAYAAAVASGTIPANRWTRLACQRHVKDLATAKVRGLQFNESHATNACDFFPHFLSFYEGAFSDKPFALLPFQEFIVGCLFGWKMYDHESKTWVRRFRTAYIEMAKGNGKTPLASGVGLYGLVFDEEPGAEIYAAATTREQAGILFRDAKAFADGSQALKDILTIGQHNIAYESANSFFRPVSSEHRGLDGKRPHIALIDEIHEHPDALVVDKIRAGTKGRRQALIVEITNSGYDRLSVCYQHHAYTTKILDGLVENDSWFGFITGLDVCAKCEGEGKTTPQDGCPDCDSWLNEATWPKANPGLGTIIPVKYIREQVAEAVAMPAKENIVKRLNFNIWTDTVTRWMSADMWTACEDRSLRLEDFAGQPCYAAFDLANKIDIAALVQVFLRGEELIVFGRYYLPEETITTSKNGPHYRQWIKAGLMTQTPGAMTDYGYIEEDLKKIHNITPILELAFDPHEATYLVNNLMGWLGEDRCIEVSQVPAQMSESMKQVEGLIHAKTLHHTGDPALAWMFSNVMKREARGGGPVKYYYPTKANDDSKIDGAVALIMAVGRAMLHKDTTSVYEQRGLMLL